MKKLFYLFCLLSVISFIGCSNDDEPEVKKFSPDVENVLTSIQGTFSGEEYFLEQWFRTDKLTFSSFAALIMCMHRRTKKKQAICLFFCKGHLQSLARRGFVFRLALWYSIYNQFIGCKHESD